MIERRLENLLALDYPADQLEIVVASDASTDRTHELVERSRPAARPADRVPARGKVAAQDRAVRETAGEIVAFSDANATWAPDALRKLVRSFADPDVAYVCGRLVLTDAAGSNREGVYWRYETWLRAQESALGSVTGGNGSIYAVRRSDYVEVDPRFGHDLSLPYVMVQHGRRAVYDPEAQAFEKPTPEIETEYRRKVRMFEHCWLIVLRGRMLRRQPPGYLVEIISHRHLRYGSGLLHCCCSGRTSRSSRCARAGYPARTQADEGDGGPQQDKMEEPAPVAEVPVGEDLDEVAGRQAAEHPPARDDQPAVLEHPHLAAVLGLDLRRGLLEREGLRVVDGASPALHHHVRQREVVAEPRIDLDVVRAPHGVHRAVPAGDRAQVGLLGAQPGLEAPVDTLAVRPVGVRQHEPAADVGDRRIGERPHELRERVGRPGRVRVGEREHVAGGLAHRAILRRDLAAARAADQPHARLPRRDRLDELVSTVGGGIRGDHDLEPVGRVVEREQVLEAALDHGLLVVRGDDHRH